MTTIPVYGGSVEWSDDGTTWVPIPGAKGITVPEVSQDFKDATSLDSPNGFKEYSKGLKDAGEITLSCNYSKALYAAAAAKAASATATYLRVTLVPDTDQSAGDTFAWQAWVTPSVPQADVEGDMMLDIKQRVTGGVTWTQGAAAA